MCVREMDIYRYIDIYIDKTNIEGVVQCRCGLRACRCAKPSIKPREGLVARHDPDKWRTAVDGRSGGGVGRRKQGVGGVGSAGVEETIGYLAVSLDMWKQEIANMQHIENKNLEKRVQGSLSHMAEAQLSKVIPLVAGL